MRVASILLALLPLITALTLATPTSTQASSDTVIGVTPVHDDNETSSDALPGISLEHEGDKTAHEARSVMECHSKNLLPCRGQCMPRGSVCCRHDEDVGSGFYCPGDTRRKCNKKWQCFATMPGEEYVHADHADHAEGSWVCGTLHRAKRAYDPPDDHDEEDWGDETDQAEEKW